MDILNPSGLFRSGISSLRDKVTNERIVLANIIYVTVAFVTAIGYIIDFQVFLQPFSDIVFDQVSSLILMLIAIFCYVLNTRGYFNQSKILFTISWLLLSFYVNPMLQGTAPDYYFHYDSAILFISVLIQILFSAKKEPLSYSLFTIVTFITILFHQQYLLQFSQESTISALIAEDRYVRLIPVYYWLLFNLVIAYVIRVYEKSHEEVVQKNQDYLDLNENLEKQVMERTVKLKRKQEDLEITAVQLKDSQRRYRDFIHNSYEGVARFEMQNPMDITMDKKAQIDYLLANQYIAECNDSFARMYGFRDSSEIEGIKLKELWKDSQEREKVLMDYIENGYSFENFQTLEQTRHGEKKWFLNFGKSNIINNYLHMLWITQVDISQQIKARMEREQLLSDLKEYAFITSHEIRRPLSNLLGLANVISDNEIDKDLPTMIKHLKTSAEELDELVRKMGDTLSRTNYFEENRKAASRE